MSILWVPDTAKRNKQTFLPFLLGENINEVGVMQMLKRNELNYT